jgi:predicted nucleotidyltransferase
MKQEKFIHLIKEVLEGDKQIVFAYIYGSFAAGESFRDIDIGIYLQKAPENFFMITAELKTKLSARAKSEGFNLPPDQFDVQILNDAPFTFLKRVFQEGILLIDLDPERRTDLIEDVAFKYRECAGILAEASLI